MIIQGYKDKHEYISDKGVSSVVYLMDCDDAINKFLNQDYNGNK